MTVLSDLTELSDLSELTELTELTVLYELVSRVKVSDVPHILVCGQKSSKNSNFSYPAKNLMIACPFAG